MNLNADGSVRQERDTVVNGSYTNSVTVEKGNAIGKSWLYFEKASDWSFNNVFATYHHQDHDGNWIPSIKIEYLSA